MNGAAWLLPLLSGALDAGSRSAIKMTKIHNLTLVAGGFFFALPAYAIWLFFTGMPDVQPAFWKAVAVHVPLLTVANILIVEAHRRSPLILTMPIQGFVPAILLITTPLMLNSGRPTFLGGVGVAVLTLGLYVLNIQSNKLGFFQPFKSLFIEVGCVLMLIVAVIFSVTSNLDYVAYQNANAPFYLLVDHGSVAVLTTLVALVYSGLTKPDPGKPLSPKGSFKALALYGQILAGAVIFHLWAFAVIPTVPYVIAGKRAGAIIFTVGLGLLMAFVLAHKDFLKERENLKYRLPGTLIMVLGMLIIVLWGKAA